MTCAFPCMSFMLNESCTSQQTDKNPLICWKGTVQNQRLQSSEHLPGRNYRLFSVCTPFHSYNSKIVTSIELKFSGQIFHGVQMDSVKVGDI